MEVPLSDAVGPHVLHCFAGMVFAFFAHGAARYSSVERSCIACMHLYEQLHSHAQARALNHDALLCVASVGYTSAHSHVGAETDHDCADQFERSALLA